MPTRSSKKMAAGPSEVPANSEMATAGDSAPAKQEGARRVRSEVTLREVATILTDSLQLGAGPAKERARDERLKRFLAQQLAAHPVSKQYNVLILYDEIAMLEADVDSIYAAARSFPQKKPLLLVLHSHGGDVGSAYLIGRTCREHAQGRFVVVVPRRAKSAATLLCCAADEIHMGSISELGPIDPQIEGKPALGLKASVAHICDLVRANPHASEMFASYLDESLDPVQLGYYERIAESAAQYAEKLLETHAPNLSRRPSDIAQTLVYSYKDHAFVIDKSEALDIFGDRTLKIDTPEYALGDAIYQALRFISITATHTADHEFYMIGSSLDPRFDFIDLSNDD